MIETAPLTQTRMRREWWWFMLLAVVLLGAGIGLRDPWPSDEPRFTLAAKQMVESGDWLFPHRGRELYSDKPPMLMWLEAASFEVTRNWRIAFLLPSLLAALMTLGLTYDLGRRFWNHRAGLYAATAVLFAFQFVYQMKRAQIDPLVTGWITLANWGLLVHFLRGPNWRAYWLGCFAAGLGVITKGVGFLALLMFVPYLFARWRGWEGVSRPARATLRWLGGALAFLAPILAWGLTVLVVAKAQATPEYNAYVNDLFFHQTAGRYAGSWSHPQPFWYFLPIVLFNWFPVSLLYVGAAPRWRRALQQGESRVMLPLIWTLLILTFFSIPVGKRDVYIMPALPMVALALAPYLQELVQARWLRVTAFALAAIGGIVIVGAGIWALLGHSPQADAFVQRRELGDLGHAVWIMVIVIGVAFIASALAFRPRQGVAALLAGATALWLVWSFWSYPLLNDSSSARGVMRHAREIAGPQAEIGLIGWKEQNLLMATGPTTEFGFNQPRDHQYAEAVAWQAQAPAQRWLFSIADAMGRCVDRSRAQHVGEANRRDWWMFRAEAVIAGCVPAAAEDDDPSDAGS
jgi:4-amino-4-deoxy-L-arabinose transferase-like glycosyltransferase